MNTYYVVIRNGRGKIHHRWLNAVTLGHARAVAVDGMSNKTTIELSRKLTAKELLAYQEYTWLIQHGDVADDAWSRMFARAEKSLHMYND